MAQAVEERDAAEEQLEDRRVPAAREREGDDEEEEVPEPQRKRPRAEQVVIPTMTELLNGLNSTRDEALHTCLDTLMRVALFVLKCRQQKQRSHHQQKQRRQQHDDNKQQENDDNGDDDDDDERKAEQLIHAYLQSSPQVHELMTLWRHTDTCSRTAQLVVSVLGLLIKCNTFPDTRPVSGFIARAVTRNRMKALYQLMGDKGYLTAVPVLRLLTAIVELGPSTARDMFQRFEWRADAVVGLIDRRAKASSTLAFSLDYTKNVRTHYVRFCLAFLHAGSTQLAQAVLGADVVLQPLFESLANDPAPLLRELLGALARQVMRNEDIPRKLKMRVLTPLILDRLAAVLNRAGTPDHDECARVVTAYLQDCFAALTRGTDGSPLRAVDLSVTAVGTTNRVLLGLARALCPSGSNTRQRRIVASLLRHRPVLALPFFHWWRLPPPSLSVAWLTASALALDVLVALPPPSFAGMQAPPTPQLLELAAKHAVPIKRADFTKLLLYRSSALVQLRALDLLVAMLVNSRKLVDQVHGHGAGWELAEYTLKSMLKARLPSMQALLSVRVQCAGAEKDAAQAALVGRVLKALALVLSTFPEVVTEEHFHTGTLVRDSRDAAHLPPLAKLELLRLLSTAPDFALADAPARASASFVTVCALALEAAHPAMARAAFGCALRTLQHTVGMFKPAERGPLQLACWLARCHDHRDAELLCTALVRCAHIDEAGTGPSACSCSSVALLEQLLKEACEGSGVMAAQALALRVIPDVGLFARDEAEQLLKSAQSEASPHKAFFEQALAALDHDSAQESIAKTIDDCAQLRPTELYLQQSVPVILHLLRAAKAGVPKDKAPRFAEALAKLVTSAQRVRHNTTRSSDCLLCAALSFDDVLSAYLADVAAAEERAPVLVALVRAMGRCSPERTTRLLERVVDALLPLHGPDSTFASKKPLVAALVHVLPRCAPPVRDRFLESCLAEVAEPQSSQQEAADVQALATLLLRELPRSLNMDLLAKHRPYFAALLKAAAATPERALDELLEAALTREFVAESFVRHSFDVFDEHALLPLWTDLAAHFMRDSARHHSLAQTLALAARFSKHVASRVLKTWKKQEWRLTQPLLVVVPSLAAHKRYAQRVFEDAAVADAVLRTGFGVVRSCASLDAVRAFVANKPLTAFALELLESVGSGKTTALTGAAVVAIKHFVGLAVAEGGHKQLVESVLVALLKCLASTLQEEQRLQQEQQQQRDSRRGADGDNQTYGSEQAQDDDTTTNNNNNNNSTFEEEEDERDSLTAELVETLCDVLAAFSSRLPAKQLCGKDDETSALWRSLVSSCFAAPSARVFEALEAVLGATFAGCAPTRRLHRLAALQDVFGPHMVEYADMHARAQQRFLPALCRLLHRLYTMEPALCERAKETVMPALARAYTATTSAADLAILSVLRVMDVSGCPLATVGFAWGNLAWSIARGTGDLVQSVLDPLSGMIDADVMARSLEHFAFERRMSEHRTAAEGAAAQDNKQEANEEEEEEEEEEDAAAEKLGEHQEAGSSKVVVYDPVYLVPVLLRVAAALPLNSAKQFLDNGCFQFAVLALSSPDSTLRQAAYAVLAKLFSAVQRDAFPDKRQTLLLFNVLRNTVAKPNMRLPLAQTSFLVRCATVLRKPDHALYTAVTSFLLARPALPHGRVPMFLDCFLQTDPKRIAAHRVWELQMLHATVVPAAAHELRLWGKNRVLDTILAEHGNPACDRTSRALIEQIAARVLRHWCAPCTRSRLAALAGVLRWLAGVHQQQKQLADQQQSIDDFADAAVAVAQKSMAHAQALAVELVDAAMVLLEVPRLTKQALAVLNAVGAALPALWQPPRLLALLENALDSAVAADDVATARQVAAAVRALVPDEQEQPEKLRRLVALTAATASTQE